MQSNEEFQCPLCLVNNRAAAKFCRKCGRPRGVLKQYVAPAEYEAVSITETIVLPEAEAAIIETASSPDIATLTAAPIVTPVASSIVSPAASPLVTPIVITVGVTSANPDSVPNSIPNSLSGASVSKTYQPETPINLECSGCTSIVRASDRFCCWCGEIQPIRVARESKACSECSQSLPARANFCFQCGHAVAAPETLRMRLPVELFGEESSEFFPTFEA
jgi:Double zinc ribbon